MRPAAPRQVRAGIRGTLLVLVLAWVGGGRSTSEARAQAGAGGVGASVRADAQGFELRLDFPPLPGTQSLAGWLDHEARAVTAALPGGSWSSLARPGLPALPVLSTLLALPPEGEAHLERVEFRWQAPPPGPLPALAPWPSEGGGDAVAALAPHPALRASTQPYPAQPVLLSAPAWIRDQRLLRLQVMPFRWQPRSGQLEQLAGLRLRLRFSAPDPLPESAAVASAAGAEDRAWAAALDQALANPVQARRWRGRPAAPQQPPEPGAPVGPRWSLVVDADAWYQLTAAELAAAGGPALGLDPRQLRLEQGGAPVALWLRGAEDGRWDADDALGFWGQARSVPEGQTFEFFGRRLPVVLGDLRYGADQSYVLSLDPQGGPRLQSRDAAPGALAGPPRRSLPQTWREEPRRHWYANHVLDDDTWYWDEWSQTGQQEQARTFALAVPGVDPAGGPAELTVALRSRFALGADQPPVAVAVLTGDPPQARAEARWQGVAARRVVADLEGPPPASGPLEVTVKLLGGPTDISSSRIYLDWMSLRYDRLLRAEAGFLDLQAPREAARLQVSGLEAAGLLALDVSDPASPLLLTGLLAGRGPEGPTLEFASRAGDRRFWLGGPAGFRRPKRVAPLRDDDLWQPAQGAEHLILAPAAWREEAERLAAHRRGQGLSSRVLALEAVWDQFADGLAQPEGIRRFLSHALAQWPEPRPRYAVLVGDGHWNLVGSPLYGQAPVVMPPNLVIADPFQGEVDSASRLAAVTGTDRLPDLAIGRMPVQSAEELRSVVAKTIAYEEAGLRPYQAQQLFVTDCSGDPSGDFVASTEQLIREGLPPGVRVRRLRADDVPGACAGAPDAQERLRQALLDLLNQEGGLFLNYVGHAAPERWSGLQILSTARLEGLSNGQRLPIALSWTCLDGYWLHPDRPSLAEELLAGPDRGAVATFSPTGLGLVTGHDVLWRGLYDAIYQAGIRRLGPATDLAKLRLWATGVHLDLVDTYTVFGDPALRLPLPEVPPTATPHPLPTASPPPARTNAILLPQLRRSN